MYYNIIINSGTQIGGTDYSNYQYTFDWSLIPEGAYEMRFSFSSSECAVHDTIIISSPDLGASRNNFYTTPLGTNQKYSNILGMAKSRITSNVPTQAFIADYSDNAPVYFNSIPKNNFFTVNIASVVNGALVNIAVPYVLILSFKKI